MVNRKVYIKFAVAFIIAFFLQTSVLDNIAIFGYSPNLLMCMVVVSSFLYRENYGLVYGIIFGLLLDFSTGLYLGVSSLCFVAIFFMVKISRRLMNQEYLIADLLMSIPATLIYSFLYWGFYKLAGDPGSILVMLKSLLVLVPYNMVIVLIIHLFLIRNLIRHKEDREFTGEFTYTKGL